MTLAHFDREAFQRRAGADDALTHHMIELFLDVQPQRMNDLAQAVARDDLAAVRALAHKLRGAFGTMAMDALGATSKRLESAAASADLDACRTLFLELDEQFAAIVADLDGRAAGGDEAGTIGVLILPAADTSSA